MKAEHVLVGGPSGAGKTTELRFMHDTFDGVSIWVNHTSGPADSYETVAGIEATDRAELQAAVGEVDEWGDLRIDLRTPNINEGASLAASFAADVFDTTAAANNPVAVQVVVDESHHLDDELLGWFLAEGRDKGLKAVFATQNPRKWPTDDLLNARYWVWCGPYAAANKGWLDYYGFPREDMAAEDYRFDVFSRSMDRLYSGETVEEYGGNRA